MYTPRIRAGGTIGFRPPHPPTNPGARPMLGSGGVADTLSPSAFPLPHPSCRRSASFCRRRPPPTPKRHCWHTLSASLMSCSQRTARRGAPAAGRRPRNRPRGRRGGVRRQWPHPYAVMRVAAVPLAAVAADATALGDLMAGEGDGGLVVIATGALGRLMAAGGGGWRAGGIPRTLATLLDVGTGAHGCMSWPPPPAGSAVCPLAVECHLAVAVGPVKRHLDAAATALNGRDACTGRLHGSGVHTIAVQGVCHAAVARCAAQPAAANNKPRPLQVIDCDKRIRRPRHVAFGQRAPLERGVRRRARRPPLPPSDAVGRCRRPPLPPSSAAAALAVRRCLCCSRFLCCSRCRALPPRPSAAAGVRRCCRPPLPLAPTPPPPPAPAPLQLPLLTYPPRRA